MRCLYMAALAAMKANPVLAAFAARLRASGHPFKGIVTAVMRKLVVILNALVRDGRPWRAPQSAGSPKTVADTFSP